MLQITMINAFSPYYPKDADDSIQIKDDRFDRTMELIRCRVIKELYAYPQAHIDRFRQEFIDDILVDGYPDKEKLNVELVSKSGIHYFVVDGRCFPTESIKEELKREDIAEEDKQQIPHSSEIKDIKATGDSFVTLIACDTIEYRKFYDNKSIKKTLTIPNWLNTLSEREGINFSQVLQEALMSKLNI